MANNYMQFSEVIENISDTELEWWHAKLALFESYLDTEEDITEEQEYLGYAASHFRIEDGGKTIWVVAEESGDVEQVANIVEMFLKECRPDDCWSIEWACTCSKPRSGEFNGGGVLVTPEGQHWFTPSILIAEAIEAWKQSR